MKNYLTSCTMFDKERFMRNDFIQLKLALFSKIVTYMFYKEQMKVSTRLRLIDMRKDFTK